MKFWKPVLCGTSVITADARDMIERSELMAANENDNDKITRSAFNRLKTMWEELKAHLPEGEWKAEKVPTVGDLPEGVPQRAVWEVKTGEIVDSVFDCVHGPTAEFTAELFNSIDLIFNAVRPAPDKAIESAEK